MLGVWVDVFCVKDINIITSLDIQRNLHDSTYSQWWIACRMQIKKNSYRSLEWRLFFLSLWWQEKKKSERCFCGPHQPICLHRFYCLFCLVCYDFSTYLGNGIDIDNHRARDVHTKQPIIWNFTGKKFNANFVSKKKKL